MILIRTEVTLLSAVWGFGQRKMSVSVDTHGKLGYGGGISIAASYATQGVFFVP